MVAVTQLQNGPDFRFATSVKQGDKLEIQFVIEDQAALAPHSWRSQMRGRAQRLIGVLGVQTALTTVTTSNDSAQITMTLPATSTALIQPGVYLVDCEDITSARTWASGTVEILRDWSR